MFEVVRCGGLSSPNRTRARILLGRSENTKDREPSAGLAVPSFSSPKSVTPTVRWRGM
jgi:hypothetical protein